MMAMDEKYDCILAYTYYSKGSNNRSDKINIFEILHRASALLKCGAINYCLDFSPRYDY